MFSWPNPGRVGNIDGPHEQGMRTTPAAVLRQWSVIFMHEPKTATVYYIQTQIWNLTKIKDVEESRLSNLPRVHLALPCLSNSCFPVTQVPQNTLL